MPLQNSLRVLQRGWPVMLLLTMLGAVVGVIVTAVQVPLYAASAKAYVSVASSGNAGDLVASAQYAQQLASSFADLAGTAYVLRPVADELRLEETPAELADAVTVTAAANEPILDVAVTDASPVRAASIANAVAARLSGTAEVLAPRSGTTSAVEVTVVDPAVRPTTPLSPVPSLDIGIGVAAGLALGVLIAALAVLSDTRIRTAQDVRAVTALPILGTTPRDGTARRRAVAFGDAARAPLVESYRSLRTAVQFLDVDDGARSIVVTSSTGGEGRTTTAVNLAVALAEAGERVVLVDADLRGPALAESLGLDGTIGLTDVVIGHVQLDQAVQPGDRELLTVLPAGSVPPNPNELLQSKRFQQILRDLEGRYDRVIIDAPPVLPVSDAAIVAHRASGGLLLIATARIRRAQLENALDRFRQAGAPLLGIVLTMTSGRDAGAASGASRGRAGADRRRPSGTPAPLLGVRTPLAPVVPRPCRASPVDPQPPEEPHADGRIDEALSDAAPPEEPTERPAASTSVSGDRGAGAEMPRDGGHLDADDGRSS